MMFAGHIVAHAGKDKAYRMHGLSGDPEEVGHQMIDLQRIGMVAMIDYAITFWNQAGSMLNRSFNQGAATPRKARKSSGSG